MRIPGRRNSTEMCEFPHRTQAVFVSPLLAVHCHSMKEKSLWALIAIALLTGCATSGGTGTTLPSVSGGKSATVALSSLVPRVIPPARPSGALGIFSSIYLSQGFFLSADAAKEALTSILRIVAHIEQPLDDLADLLQTLGDAISVDMVDLLNRSPDRVLTLDQYLTGLGNAIDNGDRKQTEITASLETLGAQRKEQQRLVRDLTKAQKDAVTAKNYTLAGEKEGELMKAQTVLSQTELTEKQTKDGQSQLKKLLDLAKKRKAVIEENRELLLSGLKVTDIPGLEDLGLVNKATSSRSRGSSTFGF